MRILIILAVATISLAAQNPVVQLTNTTRPGRDFQIGDHFGIVVTGPANQTVSVRTTRNYGQTDWGPVTGWTDASGQWSTTGQYEKGDFGHWSEAWTVGGKLANPVVSVSVSAPCLPGGQGQSSATGPNMVLTCETAAGLQTFGTPSLTESFRTPDGRVVPGRMQSNMTAGQYHLEMMQALIASPPSAFLSVHPGDEAAGLITKLIGANALTEGETGNVLSIIRAAFEKPDLIPQAVKDPVATMLLLRYLANAVEQESLKQQIAETVAYVQAAI